METRNEALFMYNLQVWVSCIIIVSTDKLWAGNEKPKLPYFLLYQGTGQQKEEQNKNRQRKRASTQRKKKMKKRMEVQRQIVSGVCRIAET